MPINDVDALRSAYIDFRRDPMARFIVNVRRTRAGQIRAMLADPDTLTSMETFAHEVWHIEYHTYLHSRRLELQIFNKYYEQTHLLKTMADRNLKFPDLEKALRNGELELHGNYIFGQGTGTFAPMIKDQEQRLSLLKQALHYLNDATLSPQQQVANVLKTKGFGENNATGLGLIFHPTEIGLINAATRENLQKMGHQAASTQTWLDLQDVLRSLQILLNTQDFIELDWFLYLYGKSL